LRERLTPVRAAAAVHRFPSRRLDPTRQKPFERFRLLEPPPVIDRPGQDEIPIRLPFDPLEMYDELPEDLPDRGAVELLPRQPGGPRRQVQAAPAIYRAGLARVGRRPAGLLSAFPTLSAFASATAGRAAVAAMRIALLIFSSPPDASISANAAARSTSR
jgi:hypothetical protein